jgi:DNA-binding transcriptional LysR family regulator
MSKPAQTNWDDLRFVLAVADHGSVASAGRALDVNHATVLRRIAAFETRHGMRIFNKTAQGYQVAPDRRALIEALREAGNAVGQVENLIAAERPASTSGIRITSTDAFCFAVLPAIVAGLAKEISIPISILSGNIHLDFNRLQADITVRPAMRLPEDLAGDRAARFRFAAFGIDAGETGWLGMEGVIARTSAGEWLRSAAGSSEPQLTSDSFVALAGLAAEGRGRAILPVFLGDAWPGLTRLDVGVDLPPVPIWVASHADLLHSGRLKRARSFLVEALAAEEPRLMGEI